MKPGGHSQSSLSSRLLGFDPAWWPSVVAGSGEIAAARTARQTARLLKGSFKATRTRPAVPRAFAKGISRSVARAACFCITVTFTLSEANSWPSMKPAGTGAGCDARRLPGFGTYPQLLAREFWLCHIERLGSGERRLELAENGEIRSIQTAIGLQAVAAKPAS
jgi:hypothetical protein